MVETKQSYYATVYKLVIQHKSHWAKMKVLAEPYCVLGHQRENPFTCFLYLLQRNHPISFSSGTSFFHLQIQQRWLGPFLFTSHSSDYFFTVMSPTDFCQERLSNFKDPSDKIGATWIIQNNFLIA